MGEVWEAEQHHPRRRVALKTIHPGAIRAASRQRFHQEAELLGQLLHPAIPQIYAAGEDAGRVFIAMEKVDGCPLDAWAAEHGSTEDRVRLLVEICDAVQHAHLSGVLHRDLKPDNILVDASGQPKVLDFGIARALDVRSDVYSLGVMAFELLCGSRPTLDHPRLVHHAPELGAELDAIVHRATARDRQHRRLDHLRPADGLAIVDRVERRLPELGPPETEDDIDVHAFVHQTRGRLLGPAGA